jgi:CRP-like cAMP-binding protein
MGASTLSVRKMTESTLIFWILACSLPFINQMELILRPKALPAMGGRMPIAYHSTGSLLLDRLSKDEAARLLASARSVQLPHGREVFRQDEPVSHVYFPTECVLSILVPAGDGERIEATIIGNEGMVGLPVYCGLDFSTFTAIAQVPGQAIQVPASDLRQIAVQ